MNSRSRSPSPRKKIRKGNMIVLFFEDITKILRELNKVTGGILFTLSGSYIKDAINYLISIYRNKQRKKNIENDLKKLEKDYDIIYNKEFDDVELKNFELNFIADRHNKLSKAYYDKFETDYPISIEHIKSRLRSRSNSNSSISPRPSSPGLPNFIDFHLESSSPKGAFKSYTKDRGMDTTETIKPSIKIKSENQIRTEVIRDILKEIYNEQNILHDKFSGEELLRVLKRIEEDSIKNNFGKIKRKRSKTHKKSKRRSYKTHRRSRKS